MNELVPYIRRYKPNMTSIPAKPTGKWRIVWDGNVQDVRLEIECQGVLKDEWVDEYLIELKPN